MLILYVPFLRKCINKFVRFVLQVKFIPPNTEQLSFEHTVGELRDLLVGCPHARVARLAWSTVRTKPSQARSNPRMTPG